MTHEQKFKAATERFAYPVNRAYAEWRYMPKFHVVRFGNKWAWRFVNGFDEVVCKGAFQYSTHEAAHQAAKDSRPSWYKRGQ